MKILSKIFSRTTFMVLMAILEILIIYSLLKWFSAQVAWINGALSLLSVVIVLMIIKDSRHLSSDMMWIIGIMLFPIPGTILYLLLGANMLSSKTFKSLKVSTDKAKKYYKQDEEVLSELSANDPEERGQFYYIAKHAGFPFYRNTGFDYYGLGDTGWPVMLEEMDKAEKFIFLEYFIIEEGTMWNAMLEILIKKAQAGVDVRVMYDDLGSFMTLSQKYAAQLEEKGIKCIPFNKINPIIGIIMNHRDHRKIMVIDGRVAFSGGVNLADEYINVYEKCGHWKDNVIRIKGEAVWSYTVMFLTHWNALSKTKDVNFEAFKTDFISGKTDGYIAPYGETPLDDEITAQNIYMGILNQANDYCYIFTPYLIIDTEFINALILAAKHGVDVRIITPGVPDKKLVWRITRSYYASLIAGGVRIFEYQPGFIHSKVFVSDDKVATVGTVNLDYRSLYLHFENGTYLFGSEKIKDIRDDVLETCAKCNEISLDEARSGPIVTFLLAVLRLFAPQM
ncbi:MAG: cardiolipin synthase [Erysipelotrichaceae bacterium]|nr:cardiolipin synthase [Erysipelotrichaceae bacterium]